MGLAEAVSYSRGASILVGLGSGGPAREVQAESGYYVEAKWWHSESGGSLAEGLLRTMSFQILTRLGYLETFV